MRTTSDMTLTSHRALASLMATVPSTSFHCHQVGSTLTPSFGIRAITMGLAKETTVNKRHTK